MGILDSIRNFFKRTENIKTLDEAHVSERHDTGDNFISELQAEVKENQIDRKEAILQILIDMGLQEEYKNSPGARDELCDAFEEMLVNRFGESFEITLSDPKVVGKVKSAIRESDEFFTHHNICVYEKYDKDTDKLTKKYRTVEFMRDYPSDKRVDSSFGQPFYRRTCTTISGKLNGRTNPSQYVEEVQSEKVTETGIVFECNKSTTEYSNSEEKWSRKESYGSMIETTFNTYASRQGADLEDMAVQVDYKTKDGYSDLRYETSFSIRNDKDADMEDIVLPLSNEELREMLVSGDITIYQGAPTKRYVEVQDKINSMVPDYSKSTRDETICKKQREQTIEKAKKSKNEASRLWLVENGYCDKSELAQDIAR